MQSRTIRIVLAVAFIGLLATAAVLNRRAGRQQTPQSVSAADALRRYGFSLQEVSHQAGIDFTHQAPALDPRLAHIMPQIASMGASVTVVDYDNDGWPDIYVTTSKEGGQNHLYHNNHDGTFTDVAAQMGIADVNKPGTGVSMGAVWGDYDNDGYDDLLLYKWGKPELFHNDHGKGFTRVTDKAGLPPWVNANSATWVDYDNDGHLDLLICGYYPENIDLWHLKTTRIMPDSFEYATNGGRKYLLRNNGDGTFTDVTDKMGLGGPAGHRWTLACVAADLRGTGYPDLILANDYGYTDYYANMGGKKFQEVGRQAFYWQRGTGAVGPKSGMNASVGDILNQGQLAVYISNISSAGNLIQGNNLWVPQPAAPGAVPQYQNMATDMGVDLGGWSFGAQFGDLNNDGNLDLFLVNGYVSDDPDKDYWYDYGKITGANSAIISDAKNWPPMKHMSLSGFEQKRVWLGDGQGGFSEVAQAVGVTDTHDGRAVALADLWNTGALDVIVANQKGPLRLYKNTVDPKNQWIELSLHGTRSNRDAIGARATLFWRDGRGRERQQVQAVLAASGFCAQNDHRLHFGLGPNPQLEKAVIRWPSGRTQT
ncbi:MAG: CRTAC1 family protein, partial [Armatimonadetes bacterium]|nr:CRTAC1 family protein [Armatimonadota bacterium]